jgi:pyridoxal phosphate enzyme (YggS family)
MTLIATIADRIAEVRARIACAAERVGRDPSEVRLVGVTKGVTFDAIQEAVAAGLQDIGENRVQEALAKMAVVPPAGAGSLEGRAPVSWHLIGRLQSNKVRQAVGRFAWIQSVDSVRLGRNIDDAAARLGIVQPVLVQINVGREAQKGGASPEDLESLWRELQRCRHLRLDGLMAVPPAVQDANEARPYFHELRRLGGIVGAVEYSMGMSNDVEVAVEEGATMVRVGTAIFGLRPAPGSESREFGVGA